MNIERRHSPSQRSTPLDAPDKLAAHIEPLPSKTHTSQTPSQNPTARHRSIKMARAVLRWSIGLALVAWLIETDRLSLDAWRVQSFAALIASIVAQAFLIGGQMRRWHVLARAQGLELSARQTIVIGLRGQFAGAWTPAALGLDGVRAWETARLRPGNAAAITATIVLDRMCGLIALCALLPLSLIWLARHSSIVPASAARASSVAGVVVIVLLLVLWLARRRVLGTLPAKWIVAARGANANGALLEAFVLSLGIHASNALSLLFALRALGIDAPLEVTLVGPLIILSSLVPLTPLGLGVTDATAATLLDALEIGGGAAATMLARATWLLISLGCGAAYFFALERDDDPNRDSINH